MNKRLSLQLRTLAKDVLLNTPLDRFLVHTYVYNFTPAQLAFLCKCVTDTRDVPGAIVEVGCFAGHTTVFLNKHMTSTGIEKPYIAIDTFSGFTPEDIKYEIEARDKGGHDLSGFNVNRKSWFEQTMKRNDVHRVKAFEAAVQDFDFAAIGPIAFCLVDVDLFLPVKSALGRVFDLVAPGGLIVVDDCVASGTFDGATAAYKEFVASRGLPSRIELEKLGVIARPSRISGAS